MSANRQNHPKCAVVIQYEWWLLDMIMACIGIISGALGFLLAGVYGLAACMG
jgi:hypothetical protein